MASPSPAAFPPSAKIFRPEIQGLRAVGAFLVAAYHIWFGRISGGVDVFFVISGFLILGPLAERAIGGGPISLQRYVFGLAKRILPAAMVVLAACLLLAITIIPETRWQPLSHEIWASALFYENWQLAKNSVDYLARDELPSLVQHYWAISTQAQFYLIMGVMVAALASLRRVLEARTGEAVIAALLAIFVGSLIYSIYLTETRQTVAYFSTIARLWEFCLGGLLYLLMTKFTLGANLRFIAGWLGLAAICACGFLLPVSSSFPGYAALWPTLAACLVILAGTGGKGFSTGRILSSPPLLRFGAISYGFYLWHWPILIAYRVLFDISAVGLVGGLGIMAVAAALAWLTLVLVEEPIRRSAIDARSLVAVPAMAGAFLLPMLAGTAAWVLHMKQVRQEEKAAGLDPAVYVGAAAFVGAQPAIAKAPIRPGSLSARYDRAAVDKDGCHQTLEDAEVISCSYGDETAEKTIALVGGSHSGHWLPALRAMNLDEPVRIVTYTKSSCLLSMEPLGNAAYRSSCVTWRDRVIDQLLETRPALVFTTGNKSSIADPSVPDGFLQVWRRLDRAGIQVAAIRDTPMMNFDVPECVERFGHDAERCRIAVPESQDGAFPIAENPPGNVHFIDLAAYLCSQDFCPPTAGNVLIYRDSHHLTATYARFLAPFLRQFVEPLLKSEKSDAVAGLD